MQRVTVGVRDHEQLIDAMIDVHRFNIQPMFQSPINDAVTLLAAHQSVLRLSFIPHFHSRNTPREIKTRSFVCLIVTLQNNCNTTESSDPIMLTVHNFDALTSKAIKHLYK